MAKLADHTNRIIMSNYIAQVLDEDLDIWVIERTEGKYEVWDSDPANQKLFGKDVPYKQLLFTGKAGDNLGA